MALRVKQKRKPLSSMRPLALPCLWAERGARPSRCSRPWRAAAESTGLHASPSEQLCHAVPDVQHIIQMWLLCKCTARVNIDQWSCRCGSCSVFTTGAFPFLVSVLLIYLHRSTTESWSWIHKQVMKPNDAHTPVNDQQFTERFDPKIGLQLPVIFIINSSALFNDESIII